MPAKLRFALQLALLTLFALALVSIVALAVWTDADATQRQWLRIVVAERMPLLVILALLLPFPLAGLLRWWIWLYPAAVRRMTEEVTLVHTVNPRHRLAVQGSAEVRQLGDAVNALADALVRAQSEVQARVAEANLRVTEERNRLAALMSELAQSVLVCNAEGRVLLYNPRAALLLEGHPAADAALPVGLGRSIFGILDKGQIVHGLDRIGHRLEQGEERPVAHFVTVRAEQLLRVQMAPVLDAGRELSGFVLMLEDITRSVESDSRRERLMRQLTEGTRASLANIRAAVETLAQYPDMDAAQRSSFTGVIRDEAEQLSTRLDAAAAADADATSVAWPLEEMLASDFAHALQRSIERQLHVTAGYRDDGEPVWLNVDSHALVQAFTGVLGRVVAHFGLRSVVVEVAGAGRFARLSLCWAGPALEPAMLRRWEDEAASPAASSQAPALAQLLARHGAEMWAQADRAAGIGRLCVQLPAARPVTRPASQRAVAGRPVYYDFDLFNRPASSPGLDERPLAELAYTVFDTETTGLSPSDGDEIIAIGAVRIVNGRLLRQECFDRLIKPRRPVRRESQEVHGISMHMLAGQPEVEQVLPLFARFAEDTVLVAHNAAFDMRFLEVAQARSGVAFGHPVLDTLMLSAVVHPGHPDSEHRLERIAARLGVEVTGRHTALGDAMTTGEIFLRLVPLLAERGIRTLADAREASRRTLYAKLEY